MKRNVKIIKLSSRYPKCADSIFLIYRKDIPSPNPNENGNLINSSLTRTAHIQAVRN